MRKVVFTICAKNYIGLAQILEKSIKIHNQEIDFLIFVADEFTCEDNVSDLAENILIAKNVLGIPEGQWYQMAFKYDITEFCTSIKPSAFNYLFNELKYDNVIFFDPDIYVYQSLDFIWNLLIKYKIVITPHILTIESEFTGSRSETGILSTGIYNLGFIALAKSDPVSQMLCWWNERVVNYCYIDNYNSLFTDQKWMDFLTCYFDSEVLNVCRHLGMNVAPWNFHEREVVSIKKKFLVKNRIANKLNNSDYEEVIFVHFSGYDYNKMKTGLIVQKNISNLTEHNDILILTDHYSNVLKVNGDTLNKYMDLQYSYNYFDNGKRIIGFHRRTYRSLVEMGELFNNPFDTSIDSLYSKFIKARLINEKLLNIDKITKWNMSNFSKKLKLVNQFSILIYKIIGFEKYLLMIKLFKFFSRYESQIHLVDKKHINKNVKL